MNQHKFLIIDRDLVVAHDANTGILVSDYPTPVSFRQGIFVSLERLKVANYKFVLLYNLYSRPYSEPLLDAQLDKFVVEVFRSQSVFFDDILVCVHPDQEACDCRIPKIGILHRLLIDQAIDRKNSYVIGDGNFEKLARNIGIASVRPSELETNSWPKIAAYIESRPRTAFYERHSTETSISLYVNLDDPSYFEIETGISFLNHLLEQLSKHSGIGMKLAVKGDLHIDDHHTVEDIGIVLGNAIREALGDKFGVRRFGFVLPLDEAKTAVSIDICNRPCCIYKGVFKTEKIGDLNTEMVEHFFRSFADGLRAALHIEIEGSNSHHMAESAFKALGRTLKEAVRKDGKGLPSTKGLL